MSDDMSNVIERGWDILQKLIYAAVVALAVFCWRVNNKIDKINDNKEAIIRAMDIHDTDKEALWRKYNDLERNIQVMGREISENTVSIQFLSGRTTP